jgi:hypothetical protein
MRRNSELLFRVAYREVGVAMCLSLQGCQQFEAEQRHTTVFVRYGYSE